MGKFLSKKISEDSNEKPSMKIIWALMYFALTICILVASCFIFNKCYYTFFYVEGYSMSPTLNYNLEPGYHDFGIVDSHHGIFNHLQRYDIVITYYPDDINQANGEVKESATSKIKRVIGKPNEKVTISIEQGKDQNGNTYSFNQISVTSPVIKDDDVVEYETNILELPFTPKNKDGLSAAIKEHTDEKSYTWELSEDEYFVMGDNWGHSTDSTALKVGPVKTNYMTGVLIAINGRCQITGSGENARAINKVFTGPKYFKQ